MTPSNRSLCLNPENPDDISCITDVSEVFPDTPNAIRAIVARLHDGRYAVWSLLPATSEACSPAVMCATEDEARAEQARLISDLLQYSRPEATA